MQAVDATSGVRRRWNINTVVKDFGTNSAILSLAADGDTVYGTGYAYGGGNFEGVFAADDTVGDVRWLQDCHGDSYSVAAGGQRHLLGRPRALLLQHRRIPRVHPAPAPAGPGGDQERHGHGGPQLPARTQLRQLRRLPRTVDLQLVPRGERRNLHRHVPGRLERGRPAETTCCSAASSPR